MEWGQDGSGWVLRWREGKTDRRGFSEGGMRQISFPDSKQCYRAVYELKQEMLGQGWQITDYPKITQEEFFKTEGIDAVPVRQSL